MGLQGLIRLIRPGKLQIPGKDLIRLIRVEIQGIPKKGLIRLIRSGKSRNYGNQGVDSIAGGTARISETRELTQSQGNRENFENQGVHSIAGGIARISETREFTHFSKEFPERV